MPPAQGAGPLPCAPSTHGRLVFRLLSETGPHARGLGTDPQGSLSPGEQDIRRSYPSGRTDRAQTLVPERAETEARFVRNLIIQIYYHQELCNDAVVFLTNRKQTVYNSGLYSTSIHKVKMNVSFNISNPGLLILTA